MKRILPFALVASFGVIVYACSSDENSNPPGGGEDGGDTDTGSSGGPPDANQPDTSPPEDSGADGGGATNPIQGIGAVKDSFTGLGYTNFTDGPVWFGNSLYFSDINAGPPAVVVKWTPPDVNATTPFRTMTGTYIPIGQTFDEKTNTFLTTEVDPNGAVSVITRTTTNGVTITPLVPVFDGGVAWTNPNDVVARKSDGLLFITDPAYQAGDLINHVYRMNPTTGEVFTLLTVTLGEHPNGIALSPTATTLYVSFTDGPPKPFINKYPVNANGTLGAAAKFAELDLGSSPDGLNVDTAGNVYCATATGIEVFKPDGTKWGKIPTPKAATGIAFGGADRKTLYITTQQGLYEVGGLKVAGSAQ